MLIDDYITDLPPSTPNKDNLYEVNWQDESYEPKQ